MCFATIFCTVVPAFADNTQEYSSVEVSNFWDRYIHGIRNAALAGGVLDSRLALVGYISSKASGNVCTFSNDGWHHGSEVVSNYIDLSLVSHVDQIPIRCDFCGDVFWATHNDVAASYGEHVESLPANIVDNTGGLYWRPSISDVTVGTTFYYTNSYNTLVGYGTCVCDDSLSVSASTDYITFRACPYQQNRLVGRQYDTPYGAIEGGTSMSVACPVSGIYTLQDGIKQIRRGVNINDQVQEWTDNYSTSSSFYKSAGAEISFGFSHTTSKINGAYFLTFDDVMYMPLYKVVPDTEYMPAVNTYNIDTRVGSMVGNYVYTGNNGTQMIAENITIVNEGDKTIYNPVTETTYVYNTYNYDYTTRTYNTVTEDNQNIIVNFADNCLNLTVDGVEYNLSYTTQHEHSYSIVEEVAATCTQQGLIRRRCSCGDEHLTYFDALGHDWICTGYVVESNGTVVSSTDLASDTDLASSTDLSTGQSGYYVFTCTRCGATNREYITGHPSESPIYTEGIFSILNRIVALLESIDGKLFGDLPAYPVSNDGYLLRLIYNALYGGNAGASDVVTTAVSEIGTTEGARYYEWYGFDSHVEWCACFVSWVADQCGLLDTVIPKFAVVDDAVDWYQDNDQWSARGSTPIPGDIVFFDWNMDNNPDHVGIVTSVQDNIVYSVEGNMGDSPGAVGTRETAVNSVIIFGYGNPDYVAGGPTIFSVLSHISDKLDDIESALANDGSVTIDDIDSYDFTDSPTFNDVYNVDDNNTILDVTKQGTSVFGKLLSFLYQSTVGAAFDADPVSDLSDFYLDDTQASSDLWDYDASGGEVFTGVNYVRMVISAYHGGSFGVAMAEIQLLDDSGVNIEWPAETTISCNYPPYASAQHVGCLIDGYTNTRYGFLTNGAPSVANPIVITINLPETMMFDGWRWYTPWDSPGRDPKDFTLEVSVDGENWYAVDTVTNCPLNSSRYAIGYTKSGLSLTPD